MSFVSTRDALIAAATDLLDAGGIDAVTLREVGHRAGVSHNAPYKHFADKEALLAAVAARELAELADTMRVGDGQQRSPGDQLEAAMLSYVAWALAHPDRFTLVFGAWSTDSPELAASAEEAWALIVHAVAAAQASDELPPGDPERLAALIRATAHGSVALTLAGHLNADGKGRANAADLVHDLFARLHTGRGVISQG
jgi:AcrR family transcriptional regulator